MLIVLTGPTASGKDTIMQKLMDEYPNLQRVITTTSRAPRQSEEKEIDYHFISESEFRKKIDEGQLIEYVKYGDNFYGTYKIEILSKLDKDTIWRIDSSRAGQIKQFIKQSFEPEVAEKLLKQVLVIYIFVSEEEIRERLKRRPLSEKEINSRLKQDSWDWIKYKENYDFIVENPEGKLDEAILEIKQIIEAKSRL